MVVLEVVMAEEELFDDDEHPTIAREATAIAARTRKRVVVEGAGCWVEVETVTSTSIPVESVPIVRISCEVCRRSENRAERHPHNPLRPGHMQTGSTLLW